MRSLKAILIFIGFACAKRKGTNPTPADITNRQFGLAWSFKGPRSWPSNYDHCNDERQSPLDIIIADVMDDPFADLQFENYNEVVSGTLMNNGHTLQLDVSDDVDLYVYGSSLGDNAGDTKYRLQQVQFHWGLSQKEGSEHTIDGNRFPMELQLVHLRTDFAELNDTATLESENPWAVIGILFHVGNEASMELQVINSFIQN